MDEMKMNFIYNNGAFKYTNIFFIYIYSLQQRDISTKQYMCVNVYLFTFYNRTCLLRTKKNIRQHILNKTLVKIILYI